mgnify:CR=1 FL=1
MSSRRVVGGEMEPLAKVRSLKRRRPACALDRNETMLSEVGSSSLISRELCENDVSSRPTLEGGRTNAKLRIVPLGSTRRWISRGRVERKVLTICVARD